MYQEIPAFWWRLIIALTALTIGAHEYDSKAH
jgi:hypothetical protein